MNLTIPQSNASVQLMRHSTYLAIDDVSGWLVFDAAAIIHVSSPEANSLWSAYVERSPRTSSRRTRLESDPKKAAALVRARRRIAEAIQDDDCLSLTKLRLRAGLSQTQLASLMNTKQPAIARLERGDSDPTLSTIEKLARALGVGKDAILTAFEKTKARAT